MSNVEIAKILIFAFTSVSESPMSIPVRLKSSGPATFSHFQLEMFFHSELKGILDKSKTTLPGFCSHFKNRSHGLLGEQNQREQTCES